MPLGMEVGLSPSDFVLDGDQLPPKGAQSPQFSANVRCGQTTGWTKMAFDMEVVLGPGDFVFDGDRATPGTEGTPTTTQFLAHVYYGQTAGWMKTPLGTEVDLGPGHIILDGVPALHETGTAAPHLFGPCLLWPRSPISATAELLCKRSPKNRYSSQETVRVNKPLFRELCKTAEPIEMPLGLLSRMDPRNHVLHGCRCRNGKEQFWGSAWPIRKHRISWNLVNR